MTRLALIVWMAAAPLCAQNGWISLFNGKDLTGWKVGGNQDTFTVKEGAIVANGPVAHCFYMGDVRDHRFKNFELKVDLMTLPGSNGGVYFHTEFQEKGFPSKGFEVQVNNTHTDPIKSGSLYHVQDIHADVIKGLVEDNKWFTMDILVQGKSVTVKLNDKQVVDWTEPEGWTGTRDTSQRRLSEGTIALQGHDPKSTVYYKNIRIKPLP
jgi:Domain of Unknown Function (DUF1080)